MTPTLDQLVNRTLGVARQASPEAVRAFWNRSLAMKRDLTDCSILLAQCLVETSDLRPKEESFDYTPERLREVFRKYFSPEEAELYGRKLNKRANQVAIANRVYGARMGNKGRPDAGWAYRGRGIIQITGFNNYSRVGSALGVDLVGFPEKAKEQSTSLAIAWYLYDADDYRRAFELKGARGVSRLVNLGNFQANTPANHEPQRVAFTDELLNGLV